MNRRFFLLSLISIAILYVFIAMTFYTDHHRGDETRYVMFANNLLQGYYSPERLNIWSGPGYPLILAPFAPLGKRVLVLLNPVFMIGGLLFFNAALKSLKIPNGFSNITTIVLALFPFLFQYLSMVMTECFSFFLVGLLLYTTTQYWESRKSKYLVLLCLSLTFLALTKVLFFYVLLLTIGIGAAIYIFQRKLGLSFIKISTIALLMASPWLFYTYHLTGKFFYPSNAGGLQLYCMTTPHENEFGDWHSYRFSKNWLANYDPTVNSIYGKRLTENHGDLIAEIKQLPPLERDERLKAAAINQIQKTPVKYARNIVTNIGRMWFAMPYSYHPQIPYLLARVAYMSFIFVFFLLSLLWLLGTRRLPMKLALPSCIFLLYIGLSCLVSAAPRMLDVVMPFIFAIIAFALYSLFLYLRKGETEKGSQSIRL